ncbi:GNAT family N-acetyltransferase [Teredinibacter haidensis]|uniref:GNAT family N-acetyltransferase n=1 Tax=Teredinibacter haidensis TaxID=2731755 RepID=UPI0009491CD0|nr:GNAT family N-acetyltransferase [Teredinibacter haidensis]
MTIFNARYEDAQLVADIVSGSNKDVADKFGITIGNNPKHPSFYNRDWVVSDFKRGEKYFLRKYEGAYVGCVAFEQPSKGVGYLNRLSVLPKYRRKGFGTSLVNAVFDYGASKGVCEISIGIIAHHVNLKNWYKDLGFVENGEKQFTHLPFDVLFMKYVVSS